MKESFVKINIIKKPNELFSLYLLASLTFICFSMYIFFIGQTVFKLVEGKNVEAEKRSLATEISQLELETLSLNDTISIDKAYELGFVDAKDTKFASQKEVVTLR